MFEISPAEIESYASDTIADLVTALEARTGTAAPVLLVNGKRVPAGGSVGSYPPESIERIDVLPPEAAAAYGYPPGQQLLNIVLKKSFDAWTLNGERAAPTVGGRHRSGMTVNRVLIKGETRYSLEVRGLVESALLESERNIPQPNPPATFDEASYRTILPSSRSLNVKANAASPLASGQATVEVQAGLKETRSLLGLPPQSLLDSSGVPFSQSLSDHAALNPFGSRRRELSLALRPGLTGSIGEWQFQLGTGLEYARTRSRVEGPFNATALEASIERGPVEALGPTFPDRRVVVTDFERRAMSADFSISGTPFELPAGAVSVSAGAIAVASRSKTEFNSDQPDAEQRENRLSGQINMSLPVNSSAGPLPIGGLMLTLMAGLSVEDGRSLQSQMIYSANWQPRPGVSVNLSKSHSSSAPPTEALASPRIETPNVRVFDFVTGERVDILRIEGGNPDLSPSKTDVFSLQVMLAPPRLKGFTIQSGYRRSMVRNAAGPFPALNAAAEAAFPDRIIRDGSGRLIRLDARPINIARSAVEAISSNAALTVQLGEAAVEAPDRDGNELSADAARLSPVSLRFGFIHNWILRDEQQLTMGLPVADRIAGDLGVGPSRHRISAESAITWRGLGAAFSLAWASAARARSGDGVSGTQLNFSSKTEVGLKFFASLDRFDDAKWADKLRISVDVDNLLDTRVRVTNQSGTVPIGFTRDELDPLGRTIKLSIRKML